MSKTKRKPLELCYQNSKKVAVRLRVDDVTNNNGTLVDSDTKAPICPVEAIIWLRYNP